MSNISKVAVIGAGSWGTALANLLAEKGLDVKLWVREEEVCQHIRVDRVNRVFLPDITLSERLEPVRSLAESVRDMKIVLLVVPSHVFREVLYRLKEHLASDAILIAATKGIENETQMLMSEVAEEVLGAEWRDRFACLAGPSFAKEVARHLPTAVTIGARQLDCAQKLQSLFNTEWLRVYGTADLIGVQLGGALKNVIAIAAGAADGLHFGHNARAALITRGLAEMTRLGVRLGANPHTFAGLAGIGDLVLTCTGDLSRNRTVGLEIGHGRKIAEITAGMQMVAEGVKTARSAHTLAEKMNVEMPITAQVYEILYEDKDPHSAVRELMSRQLKVELEH
ncbi:Glycerol-3-phosphate dehydrogenase (NAD(P)+) [uncultured Desulfatiglans sp.]|nr:Glycerol-3-phosphate dehydrogenase (NAD(P)+) [uncultured Desulfatiglans sp.]